ncbi:hypothetical protein P355_5017 [Burkholderia cenocepacia KC-01]|nr:hypothetical protein P355_5017 [Burkholderia cenocepacia KC-01]
MGILRRVHGLGLSRIDGGSATTACRRAGNKKGRPRLPGRLPLSGRRKPPGKLASTLTRGRRSR